jgi:hypothetical protein
MEDHSSAQVVEEEEEFSLLSEKRKLSKPVQKQRKKPNKSRDFFDFSGSVTVDLDKESKVEVAAELIVLPRKKSITISEEDDQEIIMIEEKKKEKEKTRDILKEIGLDLEEEQFSGRLSEASRAKLLAAEYGNFFREIFLLRNFF